jgi:hypothetical protein
VLTIPPPPNACTLDDAKDLADQKAGASPPDLTRGNVRGATLGSDQEIFLWYMTILHEVGHAIASQALRYTAAVADQATAQANTLVEPLNAAVVASNAGGETLNAVIGQYNDWRGRLLFSWHC